MDTFPFSTLHRLTGSKVEPRALGFSGSPRRNGNSDIILKTILAGVSQVDLPTQSIRLADIHFQGCIGCEKCRRDKICTGIVDGMSALYEPVLKAQGLVLVSPTHNYNITCWMKAFIDRLYCFYTFENTVPRNWSSQLASQGRKAIVAAICEQENEADMGFTIQAMTTPLEALGYEIVGTLPVFKVFDKGKVKHDAGVLKNASDLGKKLGQAITAATSNIPS